MCTCYGRHVFFYHRFLLSMYAKGNASRKMIQEVVDNTAAHAESSNSTISTRLQRVIAVAANEKDLSPAFHQELSSLDDIVKSSSRPFQFLQTDHQRISAFRSQGLVMPRPFHVGRRTERTNAGALNIVSSQAQYIPIIETLLPYMNLPDTDEKCDGDLLTCYKDGDRYKDSAYFKKYPQALRLVLYNDDIELANPLGSRSGVHKLCMFYIMVHGKLSPSKLTSIHLALVAYASIPICPDVN
mgnify:CR=1 FL=1